MFLIFPNGRGVTGAPTALTAVGQANGRDLGCAVVGAILLLWDIDHTLIENHGVNKETYALAFKLLTGREA